MIVSDRHAFAFIHIPKCAGSAVRREIQTYDDTDGRFSRRVETHPQFGRLDYTHLPLHMLAKVAPEIYARVRDFAGYAVLRDPGERFQSALAQRAKMYLGKEIAQMTDAEMEAEIDHIIAYLRAHDAGTDPAFIHFARQSDYVFHDGAQLVENLFPIERTDLLADALNARIGGAAIAFAKGNRTLVARNRALGPALAAGSRLSKRLLPGTLNTGLRKAARRALLRPVGTQPLPALAACETRAFVAEHYAADADLYARAAAAT